MKIIFILLSLVSLALGVIGIVLPLLPTTPFILLAIYLASRSSEKLNNKIIESKIYKKHVQRFAEERSMTRRSKWVLLISVDVMLITTFILVSSFLIQLMIVLLIFIKHLYFYKYVTILELKRSRV